MSWNGYWSPCSHVELCWWCLPAMCFLECLMLTTCIPLESFSTMERLAFTCWALLPQYSPSSLPEQKEGERELDLERVSTGSWAHLRKPDILLILKVPSPQRTPTGSKITCNLNSVLFFMPLKADRGPSYPTKTNVILVGWARNTSDSWNCCFKNCEEGVSHVLMLCYLFSLFFSFNLLLPWSYSIRHSISMPAMR